MSWERFIFASFSVRTQVKGFTSLLLSAFLLVSCQDAYFVKGVTDVSGFKGRLMILKIPTVDGRWVAVDSCEVTHGMFAMKGHVDSVVIATLFVDDTPLIPVVIEEGILNISLSNLAYRVSGTRLNDALYSFFDNKNLLDSQVEELGRTESQMIMNGIPSEDVHNYVDSVYTSISDAMSGLITDFIRTNYQNVLGLCGFGMLSYGLPYPMMTPLIRQVLDDAPLSFKENPFIRNYVSAANREMSRQNLAAGN